MNCLICNLEFDNLKVLSNHINKIHKLSSEEYTIKYLYNNIKPKCVECNLDTRYSSFKFKEYCKKHSNLKCSISGKIGGLNKTQWNKGKTKENDSRIKELSEKISAENNHFFGKKHKEESKNKISNKKRLGQDIILNRINERINDFNLLSNTDEYESRQNQYLNFICKNCNNIQKKTLQSFERGSLCEYCFKNSVSQAQKEIYDWIKNELNIKDIELSNREIISPKEIDIYIPSKKIGIEYHGLYWHSEINATNRNKHFEKVDLGLTQGINIFQIFQDEWVNKKDIVKSLIKNKLGICEKKIFARKCNLKEIDNKLEKQFFDDNHISGYVPSKYCYGLFYDNLLVSCLSLRIPRQKKWKEYLEVARYACVKNYLVIGGFSKLIKNIKNKHKEKLLSYVDRRIGDGHGYLKVGFEFIGITEPNYWYTDFKSRFDRFKFRARNGKSEREIAGENKVYKIWGAGNNIFILNV